MIIIYASENTEKLYLSIENSVRLIKEIKDELRTRDVVKEVCKEYGFTTDIIDGVVIKFDDIETSAETVNGEMVLNNAGRTEPLRGTLSKFLLTSYLRV